MILNLLGTYRVFLDGREIEDIGSDKARALLAYLAVENDRAHSREKLLGLIWPEKDEQLARNSLNQALSYMRLALGDRSTAGSLISEQTHKNNEPCLLISSNEIQVNPQCDFQTDVGQFMALVKSCKTHSHLSRETCVYCLARYQDAAKLYKGNFLDGFYLPKSTAFEEWVIIQRERLRLEVSAVLEQLVTACERGGDLEQALLYARKLVELDEFGEAGNLHVMRLLALMDNRTAAIEQYSMFQNRLAIELGAEPGTEAKILYQRLRSEEEGSFPRNLPDSLTPLIGREPELDKLWGLLHDPHVRLICVLGVGGSGKTHLALEAASRQRYSFRDGVYFIPLSALAPESSLVPAVAEGMEFSFRGDGDPKKQLLEYLRNKKLLMLLDSFETVIDSAGFVAEMLAASPGIRVLVTSRVRLNLSGEQVFPLGGVNVPPPDAHENAQNYGSVKLFLASARRVNPNYNPDHLGGLVRICRLVEGLPLSLLLASNWISEFSADEIADRIEQSLDFLVTEWADLPERQRSLRATFEYSWNMLSGAEQSAMMKCVVFRNPFSIQAAHQVAGCSDRTLHALLGKNTLFSPSAGHYQMHDMIRQYSLEKLVPCLEAQAAMIHQRHSDYFLEWASAWAKIFKSAGQKEMLENADRVFEDVRAAWDWASQRAEIPKLWRASEGLFLYCFLRYRFREGENVCKATIDQIKIAPPSPEQMRLEGWILAWQACFQRSLGSMDMASQGLEKSMEILLRAEAEGQDTRLGQALVWRENSFLIGHLVRLQDYLKRSAALYQELDEQWRQSEVLTFLGEVYSRLGDQVSALEVSQRAVAISQAAGEPGLLARCLCSLANKHLGFWDVEDGIQIMEQAASAWRSVGDASSLAQAEVHMGVALIVGGHYSEADKILNSALQKMQQLGDRFYTSFTTFMLGLCQRQHGQFAQAKITLQKALELARQDSYGREEMQCLTHLGVLAILEGKTNQSLELLQQSVDGFRRMKYAGELGMALGGLALAQHLSGDEKCALASLVEALHLAAASHNRFNLLTVPAALVIMLADEKKWEQAIEAYSAAMTDPIVANSRCLTALIGNRIELAKAQLSEEVWSAAEARGGEGNVFERLGRMAQELESRGIDDERHTVPPTSG